MVYWLKTVLMGMLASVLLWHLGGCASDGTMTAEKALYFLQGAEARGQMDLAVSGPPLAVGQKTTFFAGPEVTLSFSGNVDFSQPGKIEAPATTDENQ